MKITSLLFPHPSLWLDCYFWIPIYLWAKVEQNMCLPAQPYLPEVLLTFSAPGRAKVKEEHLEGNSLSSLLVNIERGRISRPTTVFTWQVTILTHDKVSVWCHQLCLWLLRRFIFLNSVTILTSFGPLLLSKNKPFPYESSMKGHFFLKLLH